MKRKCWKKGAALTWAFLECMFFSSVVLGWTWLAIVLRSDAYFPEYCNLTQHNVSFQMGIKAKLESVNGIISSQSAVKQQSPKRTKPCRPARNAQASITTGSTLSQRATSRRDMTKTRDLPALYVKEVISYRGNLTAAREASTVLSSLDGTSIVRNIFVEGEWSNRVPMLNQQRFKRGDSTNLSLIVSSLESNPLSAVSIPQTGSTDVRTEDVDSSFSMKGYCLEQNEQLRLMFALVIIIRDVLTFPLGIFFDKYGTTRTRLLTVLIFALGTLMMTFTSATVPWLVVPALTLTGVAGSAILLTNLQTANLFGRKRHVVVSLYVGAAYSNGVITLLMQLSRFNGVDIQTSFMFLTIGIVPMLVSTVAFLPKTRVPWPLPADYGKRRNQSLHETMLRKQRAWQRRMSDDPETDLDPHLYPESSPLTDYDSTEAGVIICRKPPPKFSPSAVQSLFVWSLLWFGIQRLHEAVFETRVVDIVSMEVMGPLDFESYFGYVQLLGALCSPLVGVLIDRHFPRDLGNIQATRQMQRIVPAIVATSCLAVAEIVTDMFTGPAPQAVSTLFNILHKVFTQTTMCAFVMHVHFNHHHLGKFYGLTCAVSAVIAAFQFPVRTFLVKKYSSMLPAHVLLLILSFISFAHAINAWNHCRKRLIRDQSDRSSERCTRTAAGHAPLSVHIETDDSNLPGNKGMGGDETDQKAVLREDSTKTRSHDDGGGIEMTDASTFADKRNGKNVVLATPLEAGVYKDGEELYDEDEDEETIIATALEFIKI